VKAKVLVVCLSCNGADSLAAVHFRSSPRSLRQLCLLRVLSFTAKVAKKVRRTQEHEKCTTTDNLGGCISRGFFL